MSRKTERQQPVQAPEPLAPDMALELARAFREAAKELGDYGYENWTELSREERDTLRALEITLLNLATDLVTQAVGIVLEKGKASLEGLLTATNKAREAVSTIQKAKNAIVIATALIGLAAAVPTGKMDAIKAALKALKEASEGAESEE